MRAPPVGRTVVSLLAALVAWGLLRVPLPGTDEIVAVAGRDGSPLRAASVGAAGTGAYVGASFLVEIVVLAVPGLRPLRSGPVGLVKRWQATVLLGVVLSTVTAFVMATSLQTMASLSFGPITPRYILVASLTAGSALMVALGAACDRWGWGNGLLWVSAITVLDRLLDSDVEASGLIATGAALASTCLALASGGSSSEAPRAPVVPTPLAGLFGAELAAMPAFVVALVPDLARVSMPAGVAELAPIAFGAFVAGGIGWLLARSPRVLSAWGALGRPADRVRALHGAVTSAVYAGALVALMRWGGPSSEVLGGALLGAIAFSVLTEGRGDRVPVGVEADAALALATQARLRQAGVDAGLEGVAVATLMPFAGVVAPIAITAPAAEAERAARLLEALASTNDAAPLEEGPPAASPEPRRMPWVATAVIAVVGVAAGLASLPTAPGPRAPRGAVSAEAFTVRLVDDASDPFGATEERDLPLGIDLMRESVPLGPGRSEMRMYLERDLGPSGSEAEAREALAAVAARSLPPGRELGIARVTGRGGAGDADEVRLRTYVLEGDAVVTASDVEDATVAVGRSDEQVRVDIALTPGGARRFEEATAANVQRRMAILSDGRVQSVPVIMSKIGGGRLSLTMGAGTQTEQLKEAQALARALGGDVTPKRARER